MLPLYDPLNDPLTKSVAAGNPPHSGPPPPPTDPNPQPPAPPPPTTPSSPTPPIGGTTQTLPNVQDLINTLNTKGATSSDYQTYLSTWLGANNQAVGGNAPNGMAYGAWDATRNKFYIPGYDISYDNGKWQSHTWGSSDTTDVSGSGALNKSYLTPFTDTFAAPPGTTLSQFQAPVASDILNDPSYQFRLGQGEQSLEQSAAARGLLNSGGTLADVLKYGQDFASQEYGNIYNRNFNTWSANNNVNQSMYDRALGQFNLARDIFQSNQDRPFNKLFQLAGLGANTTVQGG